MAACQAVQCRERAMARGGFFAHYSDSMTSDMTPAFYRHAATRRLPNIGRCQFHPQLCLIDGDYAAVTFGWT